MIKFKNVVFDVQKSHTNRTLIVNTGTLFFKVSIETIPKYEKHFLLGSSPQERDESLNSMTVVNALTHLFDNQSTYLLSNYICNTF